MKTIRIAVIYCSRYGHTKLLAEAVLHGANSAAGCTGTLYTAGEAAEKLAELDACDSLVFGCPTYMGSLASEMKIFFEKAVGRWFQRTWNNKIAGGFTNSSNFSGDKLSTMESLLIFAMQMGMIWVGVDQLAGSNEPGSDAMPEGPSPRAVNRNSASIGPMASSFSVDAPRCPPPGDIQTAEAYGIRIAEIAKRFAAGPDIQRTAL